MFVWKCQAILGITRKITGKMFTYFGFFFTFSGNGHGGPGWLETFVNETQEDGHLFFHSGMPYGAVFIFCDRSSPLRNSQMYAVEVRNHQAVSIFFLLQY